jgi:hypothetical protein
MMAFLSKKYRWLLVVASSLIVVSVATYVVYQQKSKPFYYENLIGKWVRPDGGYVLDIRSITSDGKMEMAYLNPRPINVSKAQASKNNGKIEIFVELKDKFYPGNYYTLTFDSESERLVGVYNHLGLNQNFDVYFIRK